MTPEILLCIIQLTSSSIVTFLAILLMSKIREASWIFLVCGFLFSFAALIYEILTKLGVIALLNPVVYGIPLFSLLFAIIPNLFFVIAFIIILAEK